MQNSLKELTTYLQTLGVEREMAEVYLLLIKTGPQTALQLSRETKLSRTSMYRLLERMQSAGLVEMRTEENTTKAEAAPLSQIARMVEQKKMNTEEVVAKWPETEKILQNLAGVQQPETKVLYYRGVDGIKQMVWNVLRAKSEVVGYTYRDLAEFIGEPYMQEFAGEFVRRNLRMRDVYGSSYKQSEKIKYDWGGNIESRAVTNLTLEIDHQMDIYDDVVSFYNWYEGEVFGIEVYNPKVAKLQRQLFELAWKAGSKT
ncbi:MAG: helix-turn-helix domain-containing protein [bacterium]